MERDAHYTAVGAFVILVTVLAGLFVYWYADGRDRRHYERYEIYFPGTVSGLSEGGPVRYLGVDVGRVRTIRIDRRSPDRVQVVADIDNATPISERTTARLTLQGVTGLLFVDLRQSDDTREVLPAVPSLNYPVINTVQSDFDSFLASLPAIAASTVELLDRIKTIFSGNNSESLAAMVQNLRQATDGLPETMRRVDTVLDELRGTGVELRRLGAQLNEAVPSLGPKVWELVETLNETATNLQRMSASADAMLTENRAGVSGFTQDTLPELERTLREARAAAEQFGELSRALSEDPSRLLFQPPQHGFEVPR